MADAASLQTLIDKLNAMKANLSATELESFREMIRLAVRSAADISEQEARLAAQGVDFQKFAAESKPQSAHAILVGKKLDDLL